jgi:fatty acid desaturase
MSRRASTGVREARDRELVIELRGRLRAGGCFARCDRAYARRQAVLLPLFVLTYVGLWAGTWGPARLVVVLAVAVVSVQLGIIAHDAGHRQVHRQRWRNELWGHLGMTIACGLSFSHWRLVHDAHHRHSQDEARDPDLQYVAVFSVYRSAAVSRRGSLRVLQRAQAWYFWPLACVYAWSLRWDSAARLFTHPAATRVDRWALAAHYGLWLAAPASIIGLGPALCNYVAVSALIGLYLVAIFAPNHMGMPSLASGEHTSYLRQQLGTARDVRGGRLVGLLMGGLEHQIEHHLFPSIGHAQLGRTRAIVTAFCAQHGLRHAERGFLAAHRDVLGHLASMAALMAPSAGAARSSHHAPRSSARPEPGGSHDEATSS